MEALLPFFPLNLVAFPNEALNLHVFEPRYKQLINDSLLTKSTFGIPSYIFNKIEYGTEVDILKVDKEYEDGRMDIMTIGRRVFKVVEFKNPMPDKLYSGGNVIFLPNNVESDFKTTEELKHWLQQLYVILNIPDIQIPNQISSFDIAHKVGLSIEGEYELMKISDETDRQNFIINHLKSTVPVLENIEKTKAKIKLNGHFNYFDPLNF